MSAASRDTGMSLRDGLNVALFDKTIDFSRNGSTKTFSPIDFTPGTRERVVTERVAATSPDTSRLSERQAIWDKQAQNADQKQAELFHIQWNLIREQMSTFSRETVQIRSELQVLREEMASAFGKERDAREHGDFSMRTFCDDLKKALEAEVHHRTTNHNEIEKSLGLIHANDRSLEAVVQKLEMGIEALRDSLRTEIQDRSAHSAEELSKYIRELRSMVEQESKTRAGDRGFLEEQLARLQTELAIEARTRKENLTQSNMDSHDALQSLSELLAKKTQERAAAQTELANRLKELSSALDEERRDRETGDRNQVAENRKEIESEKVERRDEMAALKQAVRTVENTIASGLKTLRAALEAEEADRKDEQRNVTLNMTRLQNQQENEAREVSRIAGELNNHLRSLSDALGIEATERKECDAAAERALNDLSVAFDREARQWSQTLKGIQDLIKAESVEREAGDEAAAKSLRAAVQRMETLTDRLREALWAKMLSLADRFFEYSREWRDTPPALDFSSQGLVGNLPALRDRRPSFPKLE